MVNINCFNARLLTGLIVDNPLPDLVVQVDPLPDLVESQVDPLPDLVAVRVDHLHNLIRVSGGLFT